MHPPGENAVHGRSRGAARVTLREFPRGVERLRESALQFLEKNLLRERILCRGVGLFQGLFDRRFFHQFFRRRQFVEQVFDRCVLREGGGADERGNERCHDGFDWRGQLHFRLLRLMTRPSKQNVCKLAAQRGYR
jgi:hypothetical protein